MHSSLSSPNCLYEDDDINQSHHHQNHRQRLEDTSNNFAETVGLLTEVSGRTTPASLRSAKLTTLVRRPITAGGNCPPLVLCGSGGVLGQGEG